MRLSGVGSLIHRSPTHMNFRIDVAALYFVYAHDEAVFIPGMKVVFNRNRSTNVTCHITGWSSGKKIILIVKKNVHGKCM